MIRAFLIAAYACLDDGEIGFFAPRIVVMAEDNRIAGMK